MMGKIFGRPISTYNCLTCGEVASKDELYCFSCETKFYKKLRATKPKIDNTELNEGIRARARYKAAKRLALKNKK